MNAPDNPTSLSLLERVRARDDDAWRKVVYLYSPLVASWLSAGGVPVSDRDDVGQEVFQAAVLGMANFHHDRPGDSFRGWLRGITRNKVCDYFRRRAQEPEAAGGTDAQLRFQQLAEPNDGDDDQPDEISRLYLRALELVRDEFESRTWQMFWRAAVENHAPAEIAADFGVSSAAVRQAKSRVLRRLKEEARGLIQ